MTYPEHDYSGTRQNWERRVALAATKFSAVLCVRHNRQRAEFDSLADALAWRPEGARGRTPLIYAIAPARLPGATQRSVHLDADLIAYLQGRAA